jgi:hypothetical protein
MHCGKRGPADAAMFAESSALHDWAVTALTADNRPIGLLEFEEHLLDRERPWAGTGGKTLKDLGYGFLVQYRRHVKDHINRLLDLGHHACIADPLEPLLITTALLYGRHHKGTVQSEPVTTDGTPAPACTFHPAAIHPNHRKPTRRPQPPGGAARHADPAARLSGGDLVAGAGRT